MGSFESLLQLNDSGNNPLNAGGSSGGIGGAADAALMSEEARGKYVEKVKNSANNIENALLAFKSKYRPVYQVWLYARAIEAVKAIKAARIISHLYLSLSYIHTHTFIHIYTYIHVWNGYRFEL